MLRMPPEPRPGEYFVPWPRPPSLEQPAAPSQGPCFPRAPVALGGQNSLEPQLAIHMRSLTDVIHKANWQALELAKVPFTGSSLRNMVKSACKGAHMPSSAVG